MGIEPLLAALIVGAATMVGAIGGFGGGIFAMSILVLFMDLRTANVAFALASFASALQLAWTFRRQIPIRPVLPLAAARAVGLYFGILLLAVAGLDIYAKALLTAVIIILALRELFGPDCSRAGLPEAIRIPPVTGTLLGFASGVLNGWINMGGPPIIVYAFRTFECQAARRLLITTFLLAYPFQIGICLWKGLITREVLHLFALMLPLAVIGTAVGTLLQRRIRRDLFLKVCWAILLALGVVLGVNTVCGGH
jgi:uncharacterized protein